MIPPHHTPINPARRAGLRDLLGGLLQLRAWSLAELLCAGFSPAEVERSIVDLSAGGVPIALIHDGRKPLLTASVERTDSPSPA